MGRKAIKKRYSKNEFPFQTPEICKVLYYDIAGTHSKSTFISLRTHGLTEGKCIF